MAPVFGMLLGDVAYPRELLAGGTGVPEGRVSTLPAARSRLGSLVDGIDRHFTHIDPVAPARVTSGDEHTW